MEIIVIFLEIEIVIFKTFKIDIPGDRVWNIHETKRSRFLHLQSLISRHRDWIIARIFYLLSKRDNFNDRFPKRKLEVSFRIKNRVASPSNFLFCRWCLRTFKISKKQTNASNYSRMESNSKSFGNQTGPLYNCGKIWRSNFLRREFLNKRLKFRDQPDAAPWADDDLAWAWPRPRRSRSRGWEDQRSGLCCCSTRSVSRVSSRKSLAQPRTSCTKRSWSITRRSSRMPKVVGRPPSRRPRSPPGAVRSDSPRWQRPSPRSTCTSLTGVAGCTSCTGRRGCRIAEPVWRRISNLTMWLELWSSYVWVTRSKERDWLGEIGIILLNGESVNTYSRKLLSRGFFVYRWDAIRAVGWFDRVTFELEIRSRTCNFSFLRLYL